MFNFRGEKKTVVIEVLYVLRQHLQLALVKFLKNICPVVALLPEMVGFPSHQLRKDSQILSGLAHRSIGSFLCMIHDKKYIMASTDATKQE